MTTYAMGRSENGLLRATNCPEMGENERGNRYGLIKRGVAVVAVFLSLVALSSPLVPDLPKGGEAEMLEVYRHAAMHGSPKAIFAMAYYNEHGIGMPVNREEALKWYWKLCELHGANPDGVQDEAAKAIDRLVGLSIPFDPQTADGNTILSFVSSQTNRAAAVAVTRVLRQKTVGRMLVFTNLTAFYVQRLKNGGIDLTLDSLSGSDGRPVLQKQNSCSSIRVLFDSASAQTARCLDREDVVARLEGVVVTNCPWYWGFVVKGVSVEPKDPSLVRPLPDFNADTITGDELLDYLKNQHRQIRKWQFSEIQSRLVGRRLTFSKLRLAGSSGDFRKKDDTFWLGAVPTWERVGEGDLVGSAMFKLSFRDETMRRFARQLVKVAAFAQLEEVSGTFVKVEDPDDGWAFQLADVDLLPQGAVRDIDGIGTGTISGDDIIQRVGANFTPVARLSLASRFAGREVSFVAGVVESCRPCGTNDAFSLVCRMTPWMPEGGRGQPLRVAFEVPSERGRAFRRTPIPGDLVTKLKGRISAVKDAEGRNILGESPVLELDQPDFDITWKSDVVKMTGLDSRPGDRIVRRLSLCWPEVRPDQFIRLARQVNGQTVEFARGRCQQAYWHRDRRLVVTVTLEDPLYGRCIDLDLLPKGDSAALAQGLKQGRILRHIRGVLTAEMAKPNEWSPEKMCVRMKDATFDVDVKGERKKPD